MNVYHNETPVCMFVLLFYTHVLCTAVPKYHVHVSPLFLFLFLASFASFASFAFLFGVPTSLLE